MLTSCVFLEDGNSCKQETCSYLKYNSSGHILFPSSVCLLTVWGNQSQFLIWVRHGMVSILVVTPGTVALVKLEFV